MRDAYFAQKISASTTSLTVNLTTYFVKYLEEKELENTENQVNCTKLQSKLSEFQERHEIAKDKIETFRIKLRCLVDRVDRFKKAGSTVAKEN